MPLHLYRAAASFVVVAGYGMVLVGTVVLLSGSFGLTEMVASIGLVLAGALIGVGVGNVLHEPTNTEVGVAVVVAPVFLAALMLFPPVQWVLRTSNDGSALGVAAMVPAAVVFLVSALVGGSLLALRRTA